MDTELILRNALSEILRTEGWTPEAHGLQKQLDTIKYDTLVRNGEPLVNIPKEFYTPDLLFKAVSMPLTAERNLADIPDELLTQELALSAVRSAVTAIREVPKRFHSEEITNVVLLGNTFLFPLCRVRTQEQCMYAVRQHPTHIRCMSKKEQTYELCQEALTQAAAQDDANLGATDFLSGVKSAIKLKDRRLIPLMA